MDSKSTLAIGLLAVCCSLPAEAQQWQYFGGYNKKSGLPLNLINVVDQLPKGLLSTVQTKLPEGLDIQKNDPALITDDFGANVYLVEDAEVRVVFVHEGAGYLNSVGFFTFDPAQPPQTSTDVVDRIVFPNFSQPPMKPGDAVDLGRFKAGTALGFTVVADGWKSKLGTVDPNQSSSWVFRSIMGLNPEPPGIDQLNAHTVLLSKPEDGLLVLGFEDINRKYAGDHDFNDALIAIQVTPFTAVERSQVVSLNNVDDSDKDGVPDYLDAFPKDPERASRRYYPSATTFGHLLFEDSWPKKGDYDLNDLVVGYRTVEELNAKNQVVGVKLFYDLIARGAAYSNGFALHLPGVSPGLIQSKDAEGVALTTLQIGDKPAVPLLPEPGQDDAVFILSKNVNEMTQTGFKKGDCVFFNTSMACPYHEPVRLTAEIRFAKPLANIGIAPYNPFIFVNGNRGREIHLVDKPPTRKANPVYFRTFDDWTDPDAKPQRFYRTERNYPWAIDLPEALDYPIERRDLVDVYPAFATWAESSGQKAPDWFFWQRKESAVFLRLKK